jgi:hypothetical protein
MQGRNNPVDLLSVIFYEHIMTITPCDSSLIIDTAPERPQWVAFEYQASMSPGAPPTVIYVGASPLTEVYRLGEGRSNSEFADIFRNGGHVLVRIIAIGDRHDIVRHAINYMRDNFETVPRCNLRGFNTKGMNRAIRCSNGTTYDSQTEAARALGISQSAISQVLSGKLTHAGGYTFTYAVARR